MLNKTITDTTMASASDINSFSKKVEPDPTGTPHVLLLFQATTSSHVQAMLHHNPLVAKQYYLIFYNKVTIITPSTIAVDSPNKLYTSQAWVISSLSQSSLVFQQITLRDTSLP
jgi:hypothetical protein